MSNLLSIKKIQNNPETFIFTTLTISLTCSLFFSPASFFTLAFIVFCAFCVKSETIITMFVFLYPFDYLLLYPLHIMKYAQLLMCLALVKNYMKDLINRKNCKNLTQKSINYPPLIIFIIINVYLFLPFHDTNLSYILITYTAFLPSFFSYIYRKTLDLKKLVYIFSISMIISGIFYLFKDYSKLLNVSDWTYGSHIKMKGCFDHPNIYAFNVLVSMGSLAILYLKNNINKSDFLILFIGNFIFGYLTLSRIFIISVFFLLAIFFIFLIFKEKIYASNFVLPMLAIFALIVLIFDKFTTGYISRIKNLSEISFQEKLDTLTPEDWEKIYNGEIYYDPGRFGIWKIYINFLLENPFILIFGRGLTYTQLGQRHAHSLLLNSIYLHGIVGIILYLIYIYILLDGKKIFNSKNKYIILLFIPLFIFQLVEKISDISIFYWLFMYNLQNDKFKSNDYEKMNFMLNKK